jgi:hypothetical protein
MALKPSQLSLKKWTKQNWQYSKASEADKPRAERGRYLPEKAWESLSPAEKAATNAAKRKGTKQGKQFVKQPAKVASKTKGYRD